MTRSKKRPLRTAILVATIIGTVTVFWTGFLLGIFFVNYGWARGDYRSIRSAEFDDVDSLRNVSIETPDGAIDIRWMHSRIQAKEAMDDELSSFKLMLAKEFALYPVELTRRASLRRVVLCKELTLDGQPVAGVPDFSRSTLVLDVSYFAINPQNARKAVHHEFFHLLDYLDDGEVYSDPEWAAMNSPTFSYGKGGREALNDDINLTDKFPGFLNQYSMSGVEEDKAEMFSNSIVEPRYVAWRIENDPILRSKVKLLKRRLAAFCPQLDESFWQRVEVKRAQIEFAGN